MISAFHIIVNDQQLNNQEDALSRYFEGHQVIVSEAKNRKAELYTAFKQHGDGYGRFIIRNTSFSAAQMGQLSRLMEMETYRLLALLSLPLAKRIVPQLVEMDQQLAEILTVVTNLDSSCAERDLLEKHRAETNRRFAATRKVRAESMRVNAEFDIIEDAPSPDHQPCR